MKKVVNECVGCIPEMRCIGDVCPNKNITRFYCDRCGTEDKLYHYEGEEICEECLLEEFDVVAGSDW